MGGQPNTNRTLTEHQWETNGRESKGNGRKIGKNVKKREDRQRKMSIREGTSL
jgi:hypothetical protein